MSAEPAQDRATDGRRAGAAAPALLLATVLTFTAQQVLTPVLAPLSRRLGLEEWQLGLVITTAALMFAVTSPRWGRLVDSWGPRRTMLAGVGLCLMGLLGFVALSTAVLAGDAAAGGWTFPLVALTRGVLFGLGLAAVPVAVLAVVSASSSEEDRTRQVSFVGAAQALSLVLGPALGAGLALGGLLPPVWAAPVLVVAVLVLVLVAVPRGRGVDGGAGADAGAGSRGDDAAAHAAAATSRDAVGLLDATGVPDVVGLPEAVGVPDAAGVSGAGPRGGATLTVAELSPRHPRVWPLLAVVFGLLLSLGLVQVVLGFVVQDRYGLDDAATARVTGVALVITGLVLVATQAAVVPRLGWAPTRLMRIGLPVTAAACALLAWAPSPPWLVAGLCALAVGMGLGIPGTNAAPTLLVGPEGQGRVAGWVTATGGSTFVVGPAAGTALYTVGGWLPFVAGATVAVLAWVFVLLHPAFVTDRQRVAGAS
jgi:MFS family permease